MGCGGVMHVQRSGQQADDTKMRYQPSSKAHFPFSPDNSTKPHRQDTRPFYHYQDLSPINTCPP